MTSIRRVVAARPVRVMLALLAASMTFAIVALAGAVRLEPSPQPTDEPRMAWPAVQQSDSASSDLIIQAVAAAPFSATREPPTTEETMEIAPASQGLAQLELVGTVVDPERGSFVLVSTGGAPPKVVRVGETIAGHRLRSIGQATAVFSRSADGERIELRVPRSN